MRTCDDYLSGLGSSNSLGVVPGVNRELNEALSQVVSSELVL